ncbi:MAG: hypothetical protein ACLU0O_08040 [Collinsella sp.]
MGVGSPRARERPTVYGGGSSEPNDATRALEAQGRRLSTAPKQVEGAYDVRDMPGYLGVFGLL